MTRRAFKILAGVSLLPALASCGSSPTKGVAHKTAPPASARADSFIYTAIVLDGQVFLSLNAAPEVFFGPFVRRSVAEYECATQGRVHSLFKYETGGWWYSRSDIAMRAVPVDVTALEQWYDDPAPAPGATRPSPTTK
jgi:hypothetical protein